MVPPQEVAAAITTFPPDLPKTPLSKADKKELGSRTLEGRSYGDYGSSPPAIVHEEQERTLADHYRGLAQSLVGSFPNTAECLIEIARSYEHEARWHDNDADMMRELP